MGFINWLVQLLLKVGLGYLIGFAEKSYKQYKADKKIETEVDEAIGDYKGAKDENEIIDNLDNINL